MQNGAITCQSYDFPICGHVLLRRSLRDVFAYADSAKNVVRHKDDDTEHDFVVATKTN